MLPFLDPKKVASLTYKKTLGKSGDVAVKNEIETGEGMDEGLKTAAEDILRAIEQKSVIDLGKALRAAFEIMESMPHEEGPHVE